MPNVSDMSCSVDLLIVQIVILHSCNNYTPINNGLVISDCSLSWHVHIFNGRYSVQERIARKKNDTAMNKPEAPAVHTAPVTVFGSSQLTTMPPMYVHCAIIEKKMMKANASPNVNPNANATRRRHFSEQRVACSFGCCVTMSIFMSIG